MKVLVIYRQESDHARSVDDFLADFKRRVHGANYEVIDLDSREGVAMLSLYDIVQVPAIIATSDDGQLIQYWTGPNLPLISEVSFFSHS